jgi:hypothetical protein
MLTSAWTLGAAIAFLAFARPAHALPVEVLVQWANASGGDFEGEFVDGVGQDFAETSGPGYYALADFNAGVFRAVASTDGSYSQADAIRASVAGTFSTPIPPDLNAGRQSNVATV